MIPKVDTTTSVRAVERSHGNGDEKVSGQGAVRKKSRVRGALEPSNFFSLFLHCIF